MYLSISTTHQPATDLGYLLHKHPDRVQAFTFGQGTAHVFYPVATPELCTAVMLLDIDPLKLVRGRANNASFALKPYVNDRPYVASSFMSSAIANVFGSALNGRCRDRPQLVETAIPLTATIAVLPLRGGLPLLQRLFEPLGYRLETEQHPLDEQFPEWGLSRYVTVTLQHTLTLSQLLTHLYVLIPVLDDEKHYWVGTDEIEKLLTKGSGWLAQHPEREQITHRYLRHQRFLTRSALQQLAEEDSLDQDSEDDTQNEQETASEKKIGLHQQRLEAVRQALLNSGAQTVLDLGCGEGKLLKLLLKEKQFTQILGVDVSHRALEIAKDRLRWDRLSDKQLARIQLAQGSLVYSDGRLAGFDAAAVVEVIEHLEPDRLIAFERMLFEFARPVTVIITTPNQEYNAMWPNLPAGKFRHRDHRFEWTRAEFEAWGTGVAQTYGYRVTFTPLGPEEATVGAPSQMALFEVIPDAH